MKKILFITIAALSLVACNESPPNDSQANLEYFRDGYYCFAAYRSVTSGGYQVVSITDVDCKFMPARKENQ